MGLLAKEEEKQSSFWDWVVGIGLVVLIGGFTVYYQYQKRSSISRGKQADSLFVAGKYSEAAKVYEELKNAQYLTTKDDSIIYARLDTIETRGDEEAARVVEARAKLSQGDTAGADAILSSLRYRELLPPEDKTWVDSVTGRPST
ncbi:MAG TPA: hypothetical protein VK465_04160 [Fibrobacteria bacterium]|nr:hypothetical protein [Fibrobacteria bacterium]